MHCLWLTGSIGLAAIWCCDVLVVRGQDGFKENRVRANGGDFRRNQRANRAPQESRLPRRNASLQANRAELERTERSIAKLVEAIKNGIDPTLIREEINGLQQRKLSLEAALATLPETPVLHSPEHGGALS